MPRSVSVEVGGVCGSCAMLGIQGCHQRNHVIILAAGRCGFVRFVAGGGYRRSFVPRRVSTAVLSFTSATLVSTCQYWLKDVQKPVEKLCGDARSCRVFDETRDILLRVDAFERTKSKLRSKQSPFQLDMNSKCSI